MEMKRINPERLVKLFYLVVEKISVLDDDVNWDEENIDLFDEHVSIDHLQALQFSLMCSSLVIRLFIALNERGTSSSSKSPGTVRSPHFSTNVGAYQASLPESILEHNLKIVRQLLVQNLSEKPSNSSDNSASNVTLKELSKRKIFNFVVSCYCLFLMDLKRVTN